VIQADTHTIVGVESIGWIRNGQNGAHRTGRNTKNKNGLVVMT
jgi:hypothetical protein